MGKCIREIKLYVCYGILVLQELVGFVFVFFKRKKEKKRKKDLISTAANGFSLHHL